MKIENAGIYETKNGRKVEVYEFLSFNKDSPVIVEGCFLDDRQISWWNCSDGKQSREPDDSNELVTFEGPTPNE